MTPYIYAGLTPQIKNHFRKRYKIKEIDNKTPEEIINAVCIHFKVLESDLKSKSRKRDVCWARQIAIQLMMKTINTMRLKKVGFMFNRDHTTAIHAIRKVEILISYDIEFKYHYDQVLNLLYDN